MSKSKINLRADSLLRKHNLDRGEPAVSTFSRALLNARGEVLADFTGCDTAAEVLAVLGQNAEGFATLSVSGNTTTSFTPPALGVKTVNVTVLAGSGAYTAALVLLAENAKNGDILHFNVAFPASANPLFQVFNASALGTKLFEWQNSIAGAADLWFAFNGTDWVAAAPNLVIEHDVTTDGPLQTGLVRWFRADTLILDEGASVSIWPDESSERDHARQTTGAAKPVYHVNQINGRPALTFDGGDTLVTGRSAFSGAGPRTIYVVKAVTPSGSYSWSIAGQATGTTNNSWFALQSRDDGGGNADPFLAYYGGNLANVGGVPTSGWKSVAATYDGSTAAAYRSGTQINSGAAVLNTVNTAFRIGSVAPSGSADELFVGQIAEVLVYNVAHTPAEVAAMEEYFAAKYGF